MKYAKPVRFCTVFHCDARGGQFCCADCRMYADCASPCLNHPSRCGLENVSKRRDRDDPCEESHA